MFGAFFLRRSQLKSRPSPRKPSPLALFPRIALRCYNIPMLIDTHCHIHDPEYHFDAAQTLSRAHAAGVDKIIVIGTSPTDSEVAKTFAAAHDGVFYSYGYHPNEYEQGGAILPTSRPDPSQSLIAIGEVGLDYHYTPYDRAKQISLLEHMLELAAKLDLPLIFHVREAFADFWPIVDNAGVKRAVLHSFSDSQRNLDIALEHGFYIGVNGLATFTSLPIPPLEKILLETDAPYLTPVPFRGKINEPAYIPEIASWVASHLGTTLEKVAEITTHNAKRLFHI